jgi:hypothetical protein
LTSFYLDCFFRIKNPKAATAKIASIPPIKPPEISILFLDLLFFLEVFLLLDELLSFVSIKSQTSPLPSLSLSV